MSDPHIVSDETVDTSGPNPLAAYREHQRTTGMNTEPSDMTDEALANHIALIEENLREVGSHCAYAYVNRPVLRKLRAEVKRRQSGRTTG